MLLINRKPSIIVLSLAAAAGVTGLNLISPCLTLIREDFDISANKAQLLITAYLVTISIGQIFWGVLSEKLGRRPVILIGAFLFLCGSFFCALDLIFSNLLIARVIQAIGASACFTISRVMVTDSFPKKVAAGKLAFLLGVMAIFPILSASSGGILAESLGWHFNFFIMFIFGIIILIGNFFFSPETIKYKQENLQVTRVLKSFKNLFSNKIFVAYTIVTSMQAASFFSMAGFMPYQYQRLGASPSEFGFWFSLVSLGYISGNILSNRLSSKLALEKIPLIGCGLSFLSIMGMFLCLLPLFDKPYVLASITFFFGFGNGLIIANAFVLALSSVPNVNTGSATGLMGATQMAAGGILGSAIIFFGGDQNFQIGVFALLIASVISMLNCFFAYVLKAS